MLTSSQGSKAVRRLMQARDLIHQKVLHHLILLVHQVVGGALRPTVEVPFDAAAIQHMTGILFVVDGTSVVHIVITDPVSEPIAANPSDSSMTKISRYLSARDILITLGISLPGESPTDLFADIIRNITAPHTSTVTSLQLAISCILNVVQPSGAGIVRDIVRLFGIGNIRNVLNITALVEILTLIRSKETYPFQADTRITLGHFGIFIHPRTFAWRITPYGAKFNRMLAACCVHLSPVRRKKFTEEFLAMTDANIPKNLLFKKVRTFYRKYGKNTPGLDRIFTRSSILGVMLEIVQE